MKYQIVKIGSTVPNKWPKQGILVQFEPDDNFLSLTPILEFLKDDTISGVRIDGQGSVVIISIVQGQSVETLRIQSNDFLYRHNGVPAVLTPYQRKEHNLDIMEDNFQTGGIIYILESLLKIQDRLDQEGSCDKSRYSIHKLIKEIKMSLYPVESDGNNLYLEFKFIYAALGAIKNQFSNLTPEVDFILKAMVALDKSYTANVNRKGRKL